jgi:hypothetical protein
MQVLYPRFEICVEFFAVDVLHGAAAKWCHVEVLDVFVPAAYGFSK